MKIEKLFAFPASELVLKETLFTAKEPSSSIASFKCCVATTKDHGVIVGSLPPPTSRRRHRQKSEEGHRRVWEKCSRPKKSRKLCRFSDYSSCV